MAQSRMVLGFPQETPRCTDCFGMLNRLPKSTPSFSMLIEDIGSPSDKAIAKALGVTARTIKTWRRTEAPRPVLLALFWVTRWGLSTTSAEVYDLSQMHYTTALIQRLEIKRLHGIIEQLHRIGQFGAANDPLSGWPSQGLQQSSPSDGLYKTRPEFSLTQPLRTETG